MRSLPLAVGLLGALLIREHRKRQAAERFMAAALETLLRAIDANDPQTGRHVRRVAAYALVLGRAARLPEDERNSVERVALFHDIGKIDAALFDLIHDNDDELTPDDRDAIAQHPIRGAEVLAPLAAFYPDLAEGVRAHHERWDGSGYPQGLRGEAIPLTARVVAIADSFDAITQHRRYSPPRSAAEAAEIIRQGHGTLFQPELVDLFLSPRVFGRVERVLRACWVPEVESHRRRHSGRESTAVPDVTFRWRDGVREQRPPDPQRQAPPG